MGFLVVSTFIIWKYHGTSRGDVACVLSAGAAHFGQHNNRKGYLGCLFGISHLEIMRPSFNSVPLSLFSRSYLFCQIIHWLDEYPIGPPFLFFFFLPNTPTLPFPLPPFFFFFLTFPPNISSPDNFPSHLTTHSNNDVRSGLLAPRARVFDFAHDVHSVDHFAENYVLYTRKYFF